MVGALRPQVDNGAAGSMNRSLKGWPPLETIRLALRLLMVKYAITLRELANSPQLPDMTYWLLRGCGRMLERRWIAGTRERRRVTPQLLPRPQRV